MGQGIKIGLLGAGTVGSGVIRVLEMNAQEIQQRTGVPLVLKKVLVRDKSKKRPDFPAELELTDKIEDILGDPEIQIVVELMGGLHPSREYMLQALEAGKHVVTANKDVVAQFGKDMFEAAEKHKVNFFFEASVGGGIPIIAAMKQSLTANRIYEVMGIVNGTTNYMLTKMSEDGCDYDSVLKEAQEKGYAEANPSADVDGLDAARKAAILASLAFNTRVQLNDVSVEGITNITAEDISYAKGLGYVIKLLAVGKETEEHGVDVRVHPVFLPKTHPLASVNGVFNAIFVRGNAIGEAMFYGQGAGALPTASAVTADIVEAARSINSGDVSRSHCTCYSQKKFCPLDKTVSSYYVRLLVDDKPGVLGSIATAFGNARVSLKSVIQTPLNVKDHAEIVAVTHPVEHACLQEALAVFKGLSVVDEIRNVIRVENERG